MRTALVLLVARFGPPSSAGKKRVPYRRTPPRFVGVGVGVGVGVVAVNLNALGFLVAHEPPQASVVNVEDAAEGIALATERYDDPDALQPRLSRRTACPERSRRGLP